MTPITNTADFGCLVKETRKMQNLTQAELAEVCNVGLSFIVNLEHGKETAEVGKCLHVLRMLGIDICAIRRSE